MTKWSSAPFKRLVTLLLVDNRCNHIRSAHLTSSWAAERIARCHPRVGPRGCIFHAWMPVPRGITCRPRPTPKGVRPRQGPLCTDARGGLPRCKALWHSSGAAPGKEATLLNAPEPLRGHSDIGLLAPAARQPRAHILSIQALGPCKTFSTEERCHLRRHRLGSAAHVLMRFYLIPCSIWKL
jgi:hypothetical protein